MAAAGGGGRGRGVSSSFSRWACGALTGAGSPGGGWGPTARRGRRQGET